MTRWWWLNMCHSGGAPQRGSGSLTPHSPDYGFGSCPPNVREAATQLAAGLQNATSPTPPDPQVAKVLLQWINQVILDS
ncbi:hypothetical protein HUJ04_009459 [Dendroctonus ponderosae]|nr:hypothetical protein HUJ04_009459 [Dendroctonus ponderosae]